ncbi:MAG: DUF1587 domain-containing protein, partial [Myxococcales bacterium]|nr:DUF1587 domain-containing protein [Myxococcales bacterium]
MGKIVRVLSGVGCLGVLLGGCLGDVGGTAAPRGKVGFDTETESAPQPIHRLNRLEYNNTVRDLLGTSLRPADAFPPDSESDGFDNMAEALQLTPSLLDRYYTAARLVIDDALDERPLHFSQHRADSLTVPGGHPIGEMVA